MKYFIVVGEKSGDTHAANLCRSIFELDANAKITGWGGENMQKSGVNILKNYKDLAFMGFWEVIKNLPSILGFLRLIKKQIIDFKPDIIILVDYAGFNLRIAKWAKIYGFKTAYYIAPKAWAWNANRAFKIKKFVDLLLVIFPFEKTFFEKYNINTEYVGNPILDEIAGFKKNENFKADNNLNNLPIIALLPGSRVQEINLMLNQMSSLSTDFQNYQWVIAGVSHLDKEIYKNCPENFKIIYNQTYDLLSYATAAIVTSGTATLETALFGVPQVVVYKTSNITYLIAKKLVNLPFISLVNLVAEKEVVKELIQNDYHLENLKIEFLKVTEDTNFINKQLVNYRDLKIKIGNAGASKKAAQSIIKILN